MGTMTWQPRWMNEANLSGWDRAKEALRRDWEQTKKDMHLKGGHELNQGVGDTVKQAAGKQAIPAEDRANPPKVVGEWNDLELPVEYGYAARSEYGKAHTAWSRDLEDKLKTEWDSGKATTKREWNDVRDHVRRGYEYPR